MSNHDHEPMPDELELRRRLRQLPREREPTRELWHGIEARLGAAPAPRRPALRPWILAGFAAVAAPVPATTGPSTLVRREADALTIEYRVAIGAFADASLPPALQAAATELDASAQQLRTALREQPDAPYLLDRLRRTYDQRLKLTQRAVLG
jgi:hypothetical protein